MTIDSRELPFRRKNETVFGVYVRMSGSSSTRPLLLPADYKRLRGRPGSLYHSIPHFCVQPPCSSHPHAISSFPCQPSSSEETIDLFMLGVPGDTTLPLFMGKQTFPQRSRVARYRTIHCYSPKLFRFVSLVTAVS